MKFNLVCLRYKERKDPEIKRGNARFWSRSCCSNYGKPKVESKKPSAESPLPDGFMLNRKRGFDSRRLHHYLLDFIVVFWRLFPLDNVQTMFSILPGVSLPSPGLMGKGSSLLRLFPNFACGFGCGSEKVPRKGELFCLGGKKRPA